MRLRKSIMNFVALLLLSLLSLSTAKAQYTYKFSDELGTYKVAFTPADSNTNIEATKTKPLTPRTHELRLAMTWGGADAIGLAASHTLNYIGDAADYPQNQVWGPQLWFGATLDYGYWVNEWFSIGGAVTWTAGVRNIYDNKTQQRWLTLREDYVSVVPIARFAWLRRGCLQLYSSIGFGVGLEHSVRYIGGKNDRYDTYLAYDLKPIGIAVGHKWFGFIEAGYGSRGVINVGFGYRINSKSR